MLFAVLIIIVTYLIAGIPFGLLFAKFLVYDDLRKHGSGNIGATNAARVGGKKLGLLTLLADAAKGALPVLIAKQWDHNIALLVAFTAVFGHMFSIWLKLNGGKGVATGIAVTLSLDMTVGILMCFSWIIVFSIFRISAIASLTSMITGLFSIVFIIQKAPDILFGFALCLLVFYKHKENIKRMIAELA